MILLATEEKGGKLSEQVNLTENTPKFPYSKKKILGTKISNNHKSTEITEEMTEAVVWRCSVQKAFLEISQFHRKTPVPEPVFQ